MKTLLPEAGALERATTYRDKKIKTLFTQVKNKIAAMAAQVKELAEEVEKWKHKYQEIKQAYNRVQRQLDTVCEEKQQLSELVTQTLAQDENTGIQVYIGDETPVKTMKDCSVVTATYELGEGMKGTIGIIGPKRMDYEHVMKTLKTLQSELDAIYNKEPKE